MFDKFGELGSSAEINLIAEELKAEGDKTSLLSLALENGIDEELVNAYIDNMIPYLCDDMIAALGKIKIEATELHVKEIMSDWCDYINQRCYEEPQMAISVRSKEKSLKGCIAYILKWSFANQIPIDGKILKEAGVTASKVTLGIPGAGTVKRLISEYYMGETI